MPRRLAQQRMTLSYLEWMFYASRAISAVAELLVKTLTAVQLAVLHNVKYNYRIKTKVHEFFNVFLSTLVAAHDVPTISRHP